MVINKFNIRIYGILMNENNQVLVCDEIIKGQKITKFPGGGLEFGEGTIDCIKREFLEETNSEVEVIEHFYTTDYFQQSAFNPSHQIISIYYLLTSKNKIDFHNTEEDIKFRWIASDKISENDFTLPIDKIVGEKLKNYFKTT